MRKALFTPLLKTRKLRYREVDCLSKLGNQESKVSGLQSPEPINLDDKAHKCISQPPQEKENGAKGKEKMEKAEGWTEGLARGHMAPP